MDVAQLKEKLYGEKDMIIQLLESAEFYHIKPTSKDIRCAWESDGNPTSISINFNNLKVSAFSRQFSGDIITLIQNKLDLSFIKSMKWICSELRFSDEEFEKREVVLPFGGFFKQIKKEVYGYDDCKTYDEDILLEYGNIPCMRFLRDGISIQTQEKYGIGYDVVTNRISVPWRNPQGQLIGIMGRINDDEPPVEISKWFPIQAFSKNNSIFGMYENYNSIIEKDICFVGESEKTSMVLDSMDLPVGLGLGGNVVSEYKANLIKSMRPKTIIVIMDEGLDEEVSVKNANTLKSNNQFYTNRVGYVYDRDNTYLPKGSKSSPYDYGKEVFEKLVRDCTIWI